jgi:general secretion pathway protein G
MTCTPRHRRGFTLIELLAVLAILAVLVTLATPAVHGHVAAAREAALRDTLRVTRLVIAQFYGDTGRYPESVDDLVAQRYLSGIPFDPILESSSAWVVQAPPVGFKGRLYDLRSAAPGTARDGSRFADW